METFHLGDNLLYQIFRAISKALKGNMGILLLTAILFRIVFDVVNPYFSLYVLALGGSYFDIALISVVGSVFGLASTIFAGSLTDVIGRKRLVVFLGAFETSINLIYSQAPSWEFLLLGRTLRSFSQGFRQPALSALIADSTNPEDRTLSLALWQTRSAMAFFSPFVGGLLIDRLDIVPAMRLSYLIAFFVQSSIPIIRYKYVKETLTNVNRDVLGGLRSALIEIKDIPFKVSRQVLLLIGIQAALSFAISIPASYWVVYGTKDVVGLTASEWGLTTMVQTAIMGVSTIFFGLAADKYGKSKLILFSLLSSPLATALFPLCKNFIQILVLRSALSLLTSMRSAALSAIVIDYSPRIFRGRLNAFQRLASRSMAIFGSLLGGYLYQDFSKPFPFFVDAAVMGATGFAFLLLIREPIKHEE
jgi:MFS family permease